MDFTDFLYFNPGLYNVDAIRINVSDRILFDKLCELMDILVDLGLHIVFD